MWRDEAYLLDIRLNAQKARDFLEDASLDEFLADEKLQYATQHAFQIIGEAASKLSPACREQISGVPWAKIIGLRHRLVHDYPGIEMKRLWQIIQRDVPRLISSLESLPERPSSSE